MSLPELMTSKGITGHSTRLAVDEVPKHDLITFLMSCDVDAPQISFTAQFFFLRPLVAELTAS